jgi:oxygen-independent coproporphyrinogen-3 oxidase
LPWCVRKCPYCDFNSHALHSISDEPGLFNRYVDALIADLEVNLPAVWGRTVQTIFLGGGTPSLFGPEEVARLLEAVRSRLRLQGSAEVTMEANPGSFEVERFKAFEAAGINRLSLGVQSFSNDCLVRIGRVHDATQALRAAEMAVATFDRVNIDLMFGQPGQRLEDLRWDLDQVGALGVDHVSLYQFTIEPNTYFASRPPKDMPCESLLEDMQQLIDDAVPRLGLEQYEVSAWARPYARCRHNLNVWQFGDYLGIGAGAHSKLSDHEGIWRQVRPHQPERYIQQMLAPALQVHEVEAPEQTLTRKAMLRRVPVPPKDSGRMPMFQEAAERMPVVQEASGRMPSLNQMRQPLQVGNRRRRVLENDLPFEFMLNVLRLREGVPSTFFSERTGMPISRINRALTQAVDRGLLDPDPRVLRATPFGWRFLNILQAMFLDLLKQGTERCGTTHQEGA